MGLASGVLDDILVRDPCHATTIGDHRFDDRLPDLTQDGVAEFARVLLRHQQFLDRVDDRALSRFATADLRILRRGVARRLFDLTVLRRNEWDPMAWNPSDALYELAARPYAPDAVRARALARRLAAVPEFLDNARHTLGAMPAVHIHTARAQLGQVGRMLRQSAPALLDQPGVASAAEAALLAIDRHRTWLQSQLPQSMSVPAAVGPEIYQGVLAHHLGQSAEVDADVLLAAAEDELEDVLDSLASTAAKVARGTMADRSVIPDTLAAVGRRGLLDDTTVLAAATAGLRAATDFLADHGLVTVPDLDLRVETMPPVRRGISVAYCDAPGGLERAALPTVIGIAPPPDSWEAARRESYYGEYNRHLLADLMVHEAMPGHALQLACARSAPAPTDTRSVMPSGLFIEGWAVYAEEMMADRGFAPAAGGAGELRLQQLKMRLRAVINTILDIRIHTRGMTEAEARRLMATKGFQEDGEITVKWDRARLTCGELPTYYIGYRQVAALTADLAARNPTWTDRQVHDTVLSQGSVPPDIARSLVGLE